MFLLAVGVEVRFAVNSPLWQGEFGSRHVGNKALCICPEGPDVLMLTVGTSAPVVVYPAGAYDTGLPHPAPVRLPTRRIAAFPPSVTLPVWCLCH